MSASRNPIGRLAIKTSAHTVAALTNRSHSARPSFITDQHRFDHHGGMEGRPARGIGFVPRGHAPLRASTPIWCTRRFRAIRGVSDPGAGADRPRPPRSRPANGLRQMGILLAAAPPGEGYRGLPSGAANERARHRLRPWGALPHVGGERRHRRRGDGRPRVARPVGGGEESDEGSGGRGPGPDYPCRRRIVAVPGQIVRRSRGDRGARAPGRTRADVGRNPSRPATWRTILHDDAKLRCPALSDLAVPPRLDGVAPRGVVDSRDVAPGTPPRPRGGRRDCWPSRSAPARGLHAARARAPRRAGRPADGRGLHIPNPDPRSGDAGHASGVVALRCNPRDPSASARPPALRRVHEKLGGPRLGTIRLVAYHARQCDPKKCTSRRLERLGLMTFVPRPSALPRGAVLLTPDAERALSPADGVRAERRGLAIVHVSWN